MKATMDSWPRKDAVGATLVVAPFVASGQRGDYKAGRDAADAYRRQPTIRQERGSRPCARSGAEIITNHQRINLDPEVGVADFREALRPQARERMLEGTQL